MSLLIEINDCGEACVKFNSGNLTKVKNISVSSLVERLSSNCKIDTGLLPHGTIWFGGSKNDYSILIEHPDFINSFNFNNVVYSIPFPRCLFKFVVRDRRIISSCVVALGHSVISSGDCLYSFPFGNVFQDKKICWGNVILPDILSPLALRGVISSFFNSGFNGDLFSYSRVRIEPFIFSNLIDIMSGKEKFDTGILCGINEDIKSLMV
jgi:hypothetical protein